jgi:type I restriction enzyme M protein
VARVVSLEEIAANEHNLNIARYVAPLITEETLTVEEATELLTRSAHQAIAAEAGLLEMLGDLGLVTGSRP